MGWTLLVLQGSLQAVLSLGLAALALLSLHLAVLTSLRFLLPARPRPAVLPTDAALPKVLVQLPLYNEGGLVERALAHITALDWPRQRLLIQVLDDSTDGSADISRRAVAALRQDGWHVTLLHRTQRSGFKAGALAAGLAHANAPFVAIFDADFMPAPDFLQRTVGVLLADPMLGHVQARWAHANQHRSSLTRAQARLLDGHFYVEQEVRHRLGLPVPFNGTAGVWRRAAIDGAGGWSGDTLTEDLDLSLRARMAGWRSAYVIALGVPSELPASARAWRAQQFRWTKGFVECLVKLAPRLWHSRLPGWQKLLVTLQLLQPTSFLIGSTCLLAGLPFLAGIMTPGPLVTRVALATTSVGLLGPLCLLLAGGLCAKGLSWPDRELLRDAITALVLSTGLLLSNARAVLEALSGQRSPFVRTPKAGATAQQLSVLPGHGAVRRRLSIRSGLGRAGLPELAAGAGLMLFVLLQQPLALPALALVIGGLLVVGGLLFLDAPSRPRPAPLPIDRAADLPTVPARLLPLPTPAGAALTRSPEADRSVVRSELAELG
jgi:cellulose synthase/poly-beta-1,6-N-acetylglucosamine synthase-like glycosyltransferase